MLRPSQSPLRNEHDRLFRYLQRTQGGDGTQVVVPPTSPEAREIARRTWVQRVLHEHGSSTVFSQMLPFFIEAQAPLEFQTTVLRMSLDELRHADLADRVVGWLGGKSSFQGGTTDILPAHESCTREEACLRNALFISFCETVSIALLSEERDLCACAPIQNIIKELLADEILHAKLGWAYLDIVWEDLSDEARERTRRYVPVALDSLEKHMHLAMPTDFAPSQRLVEELHLLGCLDSVAGREILTAAIETAIVPALKARGLM